SDADPWHLVVANGSTHAAPGLAERPRVTVECRYEDWTDLLGGRVNGLKLAATRRLRPRGDLRWLWSARRMFPG
ncbi:MAG: SCP2 sterol-binding domain-containing protein, partial [Thermoleophilaceae bacterium]